MCFRARSLVRESSEAADLPSHSYVGGALCASWRSRSLGRGLPRRGDTFIVAAKDVLGTLPKSVWSNMSAAVSEGVSQLARSMGSRTQRRLARQPIDI